MQSLGAGRNRIREKKTQKTRGQHQQPSTSLRQTLSSFYLLSTAQQRRYETYDGAVSAPPPAPNQGCRYRTGKQPINHQSCYALRWTRH